MENKSAERREEILGVLERGRRWMTLNEIALRSGITSQRLSYHLVQLWGMGRAFASKRGRHIVWRKAGLRSRSRTHPSGGGTGGTLGDAMTKGVKTVFPAPETPGTGVVEAP